VTFYCVYYLTTDSFQHFETRFSHVLQIGNCMGSSISITVAAVTARTVLLC
jgi:hypothetical protein